MLLQGSRQHIEYLVELALRILLFQNEDLGPRKGQAGEEEVEGQDAT